jgi:hypothetical protein
MQATGPGFATALVVIVAAVLMVEAGVAKRVLAWRPPEQRRRLFTDRRWRSALVRRPPRGG